MWPLRYSCLISIVLLLTGVRAIGEVVYAVNCGGDSHTDVHGVRYPLFQHKYHCPVSYCKHSKTSLELVSLHSSNTTSKTLCARHLDFNHIHSIGMPRTQIVPARSPTMVASSR